MKPRKFCPWCGRPNTKGRDGHRTCKSCDETDYRNPAPATSCAILRGGKVLLSLRARAPNKGKWDLVGGFVDPGETTDEGLVREVLEETGCKLVSFQLQHVATGDYDGQPTLNFLYTGRIKGSPKAADDSEELRWWPLNHLPEICWPHEARFVATLAKG